MDTVMLHYGTNKVRFCRLPAPPPTPPHPLHSIIVDHWFEQALQCTIRQK